MTRVFRKHFWAINLLTLAVCAILGARATAAYLGGKLAAPAPTVTERHEPVAALPAPLPPRSDEAIRGRNLFCSSCTPSEEPAAPEQVGSNEPVRSSLPLRLVATLVSATPEWSFAAVLDPESGRTRLVPVGGKLAADAAVSEISERRVLLRSGGRLEYLALDAEPTPDTRGQGGAGVRVAPRNELATGIRSLGEGRYEIRREALNRVLANTTLLASSARIIPAVRDGKPAGFMLQKIRPGSFYQLLGMRDGDIVQAVNSHPILTPEDALQIFTRIKNANHVTLTVLRGGKSSTFDYTINSLGEAQAQL